MNYLIEWDQRFFFFINRSLSNSFFDQYVPMLRNPFFWAPLYLFIVAYFFMHFKNKAWVPLALLIITFFILDFTSSSIIKPFIGRIRPCNDPILKDYVINLIPCGSGYSFTSTHAANHFGISLFLIKVIADKKRWIIALLLLWAFLVCFAQVYVGVHFPLDVFAGGLLGVMVGNLMGLLARVYLHKERA